MSSDVNMSVKGQKNLRETKMYYTPDNDHRGISAHGMQSMVLQRNDRQISLPADPRREIDSSQIENRGAVRRSLTGELLMAELASMKIDPPHPE